MKFDEIKEKLENQQAQIKVLHATLMSKKEIYEEKAKQLTKAMQDELDAMEGDLQKAIASYKADLKREFGITDGEQMNVLETIVAIRKASRLD